ncbi:neurotactin [Onthophagus taurus]|uniref:neurotactin n=1 Tax=Onthophagus taurus TaxID=166361 RepID=UPI0039BE9A78
MSSVNKESEKTEDKLEIAREEKEKILNEENRAQDNKMMESESTEGSKIKTEFKDGMEVKPKKIPIGGIQMPGFFMRSRSKEKCKEGDSETQEGDVEGTELLTQNDKEKEIPDDSLMNQSKVKLPIRKKADDVEKASEQGDKQKLFDRLCKPLVSIFPKNKKDLERNLENQAAGLASVETLDDNDKTADRKDDGNDAIDGIKQSESCISSCVGKFKAYHLVISALVIFLIIVSAIVFFTIGDTITLSPINIEGNAVQAITTCGKVEGIHHDDAVAFRGIPYARPPLNNLRFKPAQPLNNIDYCWNDTLKVHNATPPCLQMLDNGTIIGIEDCLTLDVVTPYVRYHNPLPVIVLIGAETLTGASPGKMRPSTRYARSKDVVFVRPNFRLGVLGFLTAKGLREYPGIGGNYALSDIMVALKWVQLNIEHFGGNPKAVTLLGHRAGASLVTALTTTRHASKLFARAWATSPSAVYPTKSLMDHEKEDETLVNRVNCDEFSDQGKCLREQESLYLMSLIERSWIQPQTDIPLTDEKPETRHQWMVLDGKILNENPYEVWSSDEGISVQLVIGVTADSLATDKLIMKHEWNEDLVVNHVKNSILGDLNLVDDVFQRYPKNFKGLSGIISDIRSVCPLYQLYGNMKNTSFYVVTQTRGAQNLSDVNSDIDAILGRYEPKTPEQRRYFSAIQQLFYHYVWHGEIDERASNSMLIVDQDVRAEDSYKNCDFWIQNNMTKYAQSD